MWCGHAVCAWDLLWLQLLVLWVWGYCILVVLPCCLYVYVCVRSVRVRSVPVRRVCCHWAARYERLWWCVVCASLVHLPGRSQLPISSEARCMSVHQHTGCGAASCHCCQLAAIFWIGLLHGYGSDPPTD